MAVNQVVPMRKRVEVKGALIQTDEFEVDVAALPELVARGVVPFRYLRLRSDFKTRFKGCEDARGVNRALAAEGYYA